MKPFTNQERKDLFDGRAVSALLPYESFEGNTDLTTGQRGRLSISGAQEKYGFLQENGTLRLTLPGEQARYIVKPAPNDRRFLFREDMPMNEAITMRIAREIYKIPVAAHGIAYLKNGEMVYLTRRFDFAPNGSKYKMEDFASVAKLGIKTHGDDYKYTALSYEDCAQIIIDCCSAASVELLKFFRQIVFNYLFSNGDAHLKNFSLIEYKEGDIRLSPAYDLLDTNLHLPSSIFALEKGLFKEGTPITDTTPIGRPLLLEFGKRIGLSSKLLERELNYFSADYPKVMELIKDSLLSESAKKSYLSDYKYRLFTLKES